MPDQKYRRVRDTVFEEVDGDILALNIREGSCFGMENVTAEVWKLLAEPISITDICSQLREDYEVDEAECRSDVDRLLGTMRAEGLVEAVN